VKNKKVITLLLCAFFAIVVSYGCDNSNSKNNSTTTKQETKQQPKQKQEHSKAEASVMAEEFVKQKLISPGSAKFPWYNENMVKDLGEGRYTYTSYVDSQNSFGALVRSNFTCTVKYSGNDKWTCEDLQIK